MLPLRYWRPSHAGRFRGEEDLVTEVQKAREAFEKHHTGLDRKVSGLEESVNEPYKCTGRPGGDGGYGEGDFTRKDAILMCHDRHKPLTKAADLPSPCWLSSCWWSARRP